MTAAERLKFPMARTCPFAPPPAYEEIREEEPATRVRLPGGGHAWAVTRHEDVRTTALRAGPCSGASSRCAG